MSVISWANLVNTRIIDSTQIIIGEKGYLENASDTENFTERQLTSVYSPDTFNVVMDFDWANKLDDEGNIIEENEDGYEDAKSEFDRFVEWYKYDHKRGVNPFEFPSISKFNTKYPLKTSQYRITSSLQPQKSGYSMRVSMTWQEVYSGIISIPDSTATIDHIESKENGVLYVIYTDVIPSDYPTITNSAMYYTSNESVLESGITAGATYSDFDDFVTTYGMIQLAITKITKQGKTAIIEYEQATYDDDGKVSSYDGILPAGTYYLIFVNTKDDYIQGGKITFE